MQDEDIDLLDLPKNPVICQKGSRSVNDGGDNLDCTRRFDSSTRPNIRGFSSGIQAYIKKGRIWKSGQVIRRMPDQI